MSFIPNKKRRRGGAYKSFLTSKVQQEKKEGVPYKSYLTGSTEQVPDRTSRRWKSRGLEPPRERPLEEAGPSHSGTNSLMDPGANEGSDNSSDSGSDRLSINSTSLSSLNLSMPENSPVEFFDQDELSTDDDTDLFSEVSENLDLSAKTNLHSSGPQRKYNLYDGSNVDVSTAVGLTLQFYISNNLPKQGLNDLLKLLDSLLPSPNLLPKTKYKFDQYIMENSPSRDLVAYLPNDFECNL